MHGVVWPYLCVHLEYVCLAFYYEYSEWEKVYLAPFAISWFAFFSGFDRVLSHLVYFLHASSEPTISYILLNNKHNTRTNAYHFKPRHLNGHSLSSYAQFDRVELTPMNVLSLSVFLFLYICVLLCIVHFATH